MVDAQLGKLATSASVSEGLAAKANLSAVYSRSTVDGLLNNLSSVTFTKDEVTDLLAQKADKATTPTTSWIMSNYPNKTDVQNSLSEVISNLNSSLQIQLSAVPETINKALSEGISSFNSTLQVQLARVPGAIDEDNSGVCTLQSLGVMRFNKETEEVQVCTRGIVAPAWRGVRCDQGCAHCPRGMCTVCAPGLFLTEGGDCVPTTNNSGDCTPAKYNLRRFVPEDNLIESCTPEGWAQEECASGCLRCTKTACTECIDQNHVL